MGIQIIYFRDEKGKEPVSEWLDRLSEKIKAKCTFGIDRLEQMGYELRRPEAAPLQKGINELRIVCEGNQYRILYGFHEGNVILLHGMLKRERVTLKEIDLAVKRLTIFREQTHTPRVKTGVSNGNGKRRKKTCQAFFR